MLKGLSLTQPHASLVPWDEKHWETRPWSAPHRGELAIVSALGFPRKARDLCWQQPFRRVLERHGVTFGLRGFIGGLPLGVVLGVVELVDVLSIDEMAHQADGTINACRQAWRGVAPAPEEWHFGDYTPEKHRHALLMRTIRPLAEPVPVEHMEKGRPVPGGMLGIFDLSPACEAAVRAQLAGAGAGR